MKWLIFIFRVRLRAAAWRRRLAQLEIRCVDLTGVEMVVVVVVVVIGPARKTHRYDEGAAGKLHLCALFIS